ncbi:MULTISPECIES: hypothetical protein [unclassified Acinetobacter]|uniref:hypothetical protein n=1 Tax=unclassified Acinetobacter TaxID=196816 RepID=UPI00293504B1|nr:MULTISPECIES: hypothetical protein [unclassified Acinetobacter]WOE32264.1 hypothetical protein QSG84_03350 [Acinetobacter sp. SAAs470]WOE37734.1 hypothetical protein QSG86_12395 [Acinetobacter sp. SAAs474]
MQFFDLHRQLNLSDIITPFLTLKELEQQVWFLAKIRVEYDCLIDSEYLKGQAVLKSNHDIQIELDWLLHDTGQELQILFIGIETPAHSDTSIIIKGAQLIGTDQQILSTMAFNLWIEGTLLPMLPNIRKDIKARLNLWDYVQYDG